MMMRVGSRRKSIFRFSLLSTTARCSGVMLPMISGGTILLRPSGSAPGSMVLVAFKDDTSWTDPWPVSASLSSAMIPRGIGNTGYRHFPRVKGESRRGQECYARNLHIQGKKMTIAHQRMYQPVLYIQVCRRISLPRTPVRAPRRTSLAHIRLRGCSRAELPPVSAMQHGV